MEKTEKSYLSKAARRYKTLFSLPKYWMILSLTFFISIFGSSSAFLMIHQIQRGVVFGLLILFLPLEISDLLLSQVIIKRNIILNERRIAAISLFVCIILVTTLNLGAILQIVLRIPVDLEKIMLFSISLGFILRNLVFITVSHLELGKSTIASSLQPSIQVLFLMGFSNMWKFKFLLGFIIPWLIFLLSSHIFIKLIDKRGTEAVGIGAISLFKAFLSSWIANLSTPLEEYFEVLGSNSNVTVKRIAFKKGKHVEALVVVPLIHPGPFQNVGSSNLPYMIQKKLEDENKIVVAVPHGTCGHELNLTSQKQSRKVINNLLDLSRFPAFTNKASKFVRARKGLAKASCQIFGNVAFITLTLSPANMEDVPMDVGLRIMKSGASQGIKNVVVVDAHNSLERKNELVVLSNEALEELLSVAEIAIKKAVREEQFPFQIGVAKLQPKDLGVNEGLGPGGIVVLLVAVKNQTIAYVIIDGNNLISGFREEILKSLQDLIDDGEVLTTDTHVVNAVISIDRGYRTVGEAGNREEIISYIKKGVLQAHTCLSEAESSSVTDAIQNVKVIGEKSLRQLSTLIDAMFTYIKKYLILIYAPAILLSLMFFIIILFNR